MSRFEPRPHEVKRCLRDRVRSVYENDIWLSYRPDIDPRPRIFECRRTDSSDESGIHQIYTQKEASERAESWCRALFHLANSRRVHLSGLDAAFADFVQCQYLYPPDGLDTVAEASKLLNRLPSTPIVSEEVFRNVSMPKCPDYYHSGATSPTAGHNLLLTDLWAQLRVVTFINTNIIRMALHMVQYRSISADNAREFVDLTAELLEEAMRLSERSSKGTERAIWFIVKAFLWTSWQRSMMLLYHYILTQSLREGFDSWHRKLDLRTYMSSAAHETLSRSLRFPLQGIIQSKYMCTWALNLLRTDRAAVGRDYRCVYDKFSKVFGDTPARCNQGSAEPCAGTGPDSCQRFTGMKIDNQSMHDSTCLGQCSKLVWDEVAYRVVDGARAVSIGKTNSTQLGYCAASENTLAISHVWSHGQGGRPELGFNSCLHRRYAAIASSFECDSYWMDTPCIPEDHDLRAESIAKINDVFTRSRLTLICDRDLMSIDVSPQNLTIELKECILAVLLVCDWNVRSWTFLESMRGRRNIHLLCKDNAVISLMDVLNSVHREGAIDLVIHFLGTQHLIPTGILEQDANSYQRRISAGFVSLEEAACLLSYRHASRPGDDMVVWSLLCQEKAHGSAEAFWRGRIHKPEICDIDIESCGCYINTGLLISSQPRLQNCRGFTWAPASLIPEIVAHPGGGKRYQVFDGRDTNMARITKDGLRGGWMIHEYNESDAGKRRTFLDRLCPMDSHQVGSIEVWQKIINRFLVGYRFGALLQPRLSGIRANGGVWGFRAPASYQGRIEGELFAVVGSHDRLTWEWKGVFEWDRSIPLPKMFNTNHMPNPSGRTSKAGILLV